MINLIKGILWTLFGMFCGFIALFSLFAGCVDIFINDKLEVIFIAPLCVFAAGWSSIKAFKEAFGILSEE